MGIARFELLLDAGVDAIVVDTAHGHSIGVLATIEQIKKMNGDTQIIGGI